MSNSDNERSIISAGHSGGGAGGGDDDDEEDDVCGGDCGVNRNQRGHMHKMDFRKAKRVVMSPFRKAKKQQLHQPHGNTASPGSGAATTNARRRGKRMIGCFLCLKQPPTLESPIDSHSPDPNNPDVFSYECLKSLIENNDFYCKECNPHIDIISQNSD